MADPPEFPTNRTFRVECPECGRAHIFDDPGADVDANPLLGRRMCVDLHRRREAVENGAASLAEALGLEGPDA